jgi:endonuclease I
MVTTLMSRTLALATVCFCCSSRGVWSQTTMYSGCDVEEYYAGLPSDRSSWSRMALENLLAEQRNKLPYSSSSGGDDVWAALTDLDQGATEGTVRLIYSQRDTPSLPRGTATTWNREHLFPSSRGVRESGSDYTDVHHLRPADWNVNSARNNLYFGNCDTAQCTVPAIAEAASDTAKDSSIFTPPAVDRGDIARALFYMDVRYSAGNNGGDDLVLTDCPNPDVDDPATTSRDMAFLSVLLQWNTADPVSDEERARNSRVCERWQGNRNPFVDFPELVPQIFGVPQAVPYNCSLQGSASPTHGDDGSSVNILGPGDGDDGSSVNILGPGEVMIIAIQSDNPDLVALVALADISAGTTIVITDNAWTGTSFLSNEGTIKLTLPNSIAAGTVFGYGEGMLFGNAWADSGGSLSLTASGEQILVYTYAGDEILHLSGLSFNGDWDVGSTFSTESSALPNSIQDFAITLSHFDNYKYVGPVEGSRSDLQVSIRLSSNWQGSNTGTLLAATLPPAFAVSSGSFATSFQIGGYWFSTAALMYALVF